MSQAQRVYDWERNFVEPKAMDYLSREDCLSLVRRGAQLAGMDVPNVRFAKSAAMPCRAVPDRWEIVIADWGRTPVTVLHELAHLAAVRGMAPGEDVHGPVFMGWACAYYSLLLGIDRAYLLRSAGGVALSVARLSQLHEVQPRQGFSEVEF